MRHFFRGIMMFLRDSLHLSNSTPYIRYADILYTRVHGKKAIHGNHAFM